MQYFAFFSFLYLKEHDGKIQNSNIVLSINPSSLSKMRR